MAIGNGLGVKTIGLFTNMDSPVGQMVGSALEVYEAIQILHGSNTNGRLLDLVKSIGEW